MNRQPPEATLWPLAELRLVRRPDQRLLAQAEPPSWPVRHMHAPVLKLQPLKVFEPGLLQVGGAGQGECVHEYASVQIVPRLLSSAQTLLWRSVILVTVTHRAKAIVQNVSVSTDKGSVDHIDGFLDQITKENEMNKFESLFKPLTWFMALLLAAFVAGCGGGGDGGSTATGPSAQKLAAIRVGGVGPAPVNLGTAGTFAILSKTGITDVYASAITGNVGTSPITGAALLLTCGEVTGKVYVVDAAGPLPCAINDATTLTAAVLDMETAYLDAEGRVSPDFTELGAGEVGGLTLTPGLYKWGTPLLISTDVTLKGGPNDVWIFQVAGTLNQANGTRVTLAGGALAKNIFWQVADAVTIGTTAHFEGVVLGKTLVAVNTGASANGRLLAQTAVTLQMNAITQPAQ